MQQKSYS